MNRILLDTHAFLWFLFDDPRLSATAAQAIEDSGTRNAISIASLWEITIKAQLGRLSLGMSLPVFLDRFVEGRDLDVLGIDPANLRYYDNLPLLHRDPFDRLLIAQAQNAGLPIVTRDPTFGRYSVACIW